ncbi:MAG: hypothetical protein JWR26_3054 [Pedosphaera sp.]|nr:hypothetical protein [Pedosphaera sp.]
MVAVYQSKIVRQLRPANALTFVSESTVSEIEAGEISCETVGQKTFGLLALPRAWTLPFFAISAKLHSQYASNPESRKRLLTDWSLLLGDAAAKVGINAKDEILVRSSGRAEGIAKRGGFHSSRGVMDNIQMTLADCLDKLVTDEDLKGEHIPLLVQKACKPERAKGHLSNERRCYIEKRDWMGEIESANSESSHNFKINIRKWREDLPENQNEALSSSLSLHISEVLKNAAKWAYRQNVRVHFEWVWDGRFVYLVQADEEVSWDGHDPVTEHRTRKYEAFAFSPQCLKTVNAQHAKRFGKIANAFMYSRLKLPTAPLYILDDPKILSQISNGHIPATLQADIAELVKRSLIIRTDVATSNLREKQLLPRTDGVRDTATAFEWLIAESKLLLSLKHESAFIFHNFIPARSAAFAYAAPNEPVVQIESLWGLPEGLYYNSHDQFVVNTGKVEIDFISPDDIDSFSVREILNFKHFFVSATPSGKWETLSLKAPFDWKRSLSHKECKMIAYESRRIANASNRPVSIMWFVGVPSGVANKPAIPWYHEEIDITKDRSSMATRKKTPFDKCFLIQSLNDVHNLENGMQTSAPGDRIRIQPLEEKLLRDKDTLKKIGLLAKAKEAVIVLEGAVLSHAYYQLLSTGAIVEVVNPFIGFEEKHEFNKLVRDNVPEIIRQRGESVKTALLDKESLVIALREKLIEEAYELLDAKDEQSVIEELADVKEVIDCLIQKLNVTVADVDTAQIKKRHDRGGFSQGVVLVETQSLPPTSKTLVNKESHLKGFQPGGDPAKVINETDIQRRSESQEKRTDRRVATGKVEIKASISIPVTRRTAWTTETVEERVEDVGERTVRGRVKGIRKGSQWHFEVSVLIDDAQLELLRIDDHQLNLL